MDEDKGKYEPPEFKVHGSVQELTNTLGGEAVDDFGGSTL